MSTPQLPPGALVDGMTVGARARVRHGAAIYAARDPSGQAAWLTIYDAHCFPSALVLERSLRELRQLQAVTSSRVLTVRGAGRFGDGLYEVNDACDGATLSDHLHGGPLPLADAAGLVVQVGEALLEAQRVGVIHRNLGADVIFPSPDGVRVCGFCVGEPHGGGSFGALHTMAPEQVEGKIVDQRTLIYNLAALMHWMLAGSPLYGGEPASVLEQHLTGELPGGLHDGLTRALSKDPRMRPMILKQFLSEIAGLAGVEPPRLAPPVSRPQPGAAPDVGGTGRPTGDEEAPATGRLPSSRGWTMFMKAADDDNAAPPAASPSAPAPSTRGWTQFTEPEPEDAPDRSASAGEAPEGPSTRGWTLFTREDAVDEAGTGTRETPAADAPTPTKPSTRGWTMFMAASSDPPPSQPVAPPTLESADAPPSTRGWTSLMTDEDAPTEPPAAAAVTDPRLQAPTGAVTGPTGDRRPPATVRTNAIVSPPVVETEGAVDAPTSRGWTMFMEGEANVPSDSGRPIEPPSHQQTSPANPQATETVLPAPGEKKRGWTMFMDAPIPPGAGGMPGGPPIAGPQPPARGGWTAFADPKPPSPDLVAPAADPPLPPSAGATGGVLAVPPEPAASAPDRGRTVLSTDLAQASAAAMAAGPPPGSIDTMYFKKGESEPEGAAAIRPITRDVIPPRNMGAAREPPRPSAAAYDPTAAPGAPGRAAPIAPPRSRAKAIVLTVAAVVVLGAAVGGFLVFGP